MNSSHIRRLFGETKERVASLRNVSIQGSIDYDEVSCVYNRTVQLCILDIILAKHREEHGLQFNGLDGKNALYHKLLLKFKWPLDQIRKLTLSDSLLALHEELKIENLDSEFSIFLTRALSQFGQARFPDVIEEEWDPDAFQKIQAQNRW